MTEFPPTLFFDPQRSTRILTQLHELFISSGSNYSVDEFSHALLHPLQKSADADLATTNLLRFAESATSKASLFNDIVKHPVLMDVLIKILSSSQYFADILVRDPELFRWLTASDALVKPRSKEFLRDEVQRAMNMFQKPERKLDSLKRLYRREILRIGVRDILAEAERLFRESLAIRRSLLSDNHSDVAANKIKLGLFLVEHGSQYQEAEQLCREALAALIAHNPNLKRLIARAYLGIGRSTEKQGRLAEGEMALRKSVAYFAEVQPFNAKSIADAELSLAGNLLAQRRFGDAEATLLHTQVMLKNASADSSLEMLKAKERLADLYAVWKNQ